METVDLRRGRIGRVDDRHVVGRGLAGSLRPTADRRPPLPHEQPSIRVDYADPPIGQVLREILPGHIQDQGIEFDVVNLSIGVLEDLLRGAGNAAADQQHAPGVGPLGHGEMDGLLHLFRIVRGEEHHAVLDEVVLPRRFGDHQAAVRRIAAKDDPLTWKADLSRRPIQVPREHHPGQNDRRASRRRRERAVAKDPGRQCGHQQVQHRGKAEDLQVVQPGDQEEGERQPTADSAKVVEKIDPADTGGLVSRRQNPCGQGEQVPDRETVGGQEDEAAHDRLGHPDFRPTHKDQVADRAQQKDGGQRQQGDSRLGHHENRRGARQWGEGSNGVRE